MYTLKVKSHFDAAHYIRDYKGKCSREHGHRWVVEVALEGKDLDSRNILVDFKDVKKALEGLLEHYLDHYQLNDSLNEPNLTAEFLAKWLYDTLIERPTLWDLRLAGVTIWESPECSIAYAENELFNTSVKALK